MQKYIAVVNPSMDEDEITRLIRKGIAGALFEISHQNYPVAMRLIDLVQKLSKKYHKPISLIQDVSEMEDPLDLEVGLKSGVHWVASDKEQHMKMAKGLNKLAGLIFKGRKLPKGIQVDSVMADNFVDPDAQVLGQPHNQIKHFTAEHKNQPLLDTLLHLAHQADTHAIAVSDLGLAKALSMRRPKRKILFVPENPDHASRAAIYWGVYPVFAGPNAFASARNQELVRQGQRVMDATTPKHITVHMV